jgi:hypothetical protein
MATAMNNLQRTDVSAEWRDRFRATIDDVWETLAHRTVATESRLRLMSAVDNAATTQAEGTVLGEEVLARLSPELITLFGSDAEALGRVVKAWRKRTPGLAPGAPPGKWALLATLWERATGEGTEPSAWKQIWMSTRREKQKTRAEAVARANAANEERSHHAKKRDWEDVPYPFARGDALPTIVVRWSPNPHDVTTRRSARTSKRSRCST